MAKDGWLGITSLNKVALGVAALAYAKAGIPVFPLHGIVPHGDGAIGCDCQEGRNCEHPGKHPMVRWTKECTSDEEQIQHWWSSWPNANVGIPTGTRSGLIVLDLDMDELQQLDSRGQPLVVIVEGQAEFAAWLERETGGQYGLHQLLSTTAVASTGGGTHIWVKDPFGVKSINGWLPACDIKAEGGYVVAAPSRHVSGSRYAWSCQNSPESLPEPVSIKLRLARGTRVRTQGEDATGANPEDSGGSGLFSQAELELYAQEGPPPGRRDDFFNAYAFALRKRGWEQSEAVAQVRKVWEVTRGGGATQPGVSQLSWQTALEKVNRVWLEVQPDPAGGQVQQELMAWVRGQQEPQDLPQAAGPAVPPSDQQYQILDGLPVNAEVSTDWGNMQRYARLLSDRLRYVRGVGVGWLVRDGYRWRQDELGKATYVGAQEVIADLMRQAERSPADQAPLWAAWSRQTQSITRITAMVKLAEVHPALALSVDQLDADPWLLATDAGVIDLRTWPAPDCMRQGRIDEYCTRLAGVPYDPAADPQVACPHWLQHVSLITSTANGHPDPALAAYLQRWAGYTLTGLVQEQKFAFCFGEGDNGKNAFIETLMLVMGSYAQTGSIKLLTGSGQEHETVIADLAGPRLVFIDEAPKGRINESRIKQLTGTSRIRARRIAKDSFEFAARFKIWIAGNNRPRVTDTTLGFWRRLDLIPFDAVIPAQRRIKDYAQILAQDEGPGILNWMLQGLAAYREMGLEQPSRVAAAGRLYRQEEDQMGQFTSETFDTGAPRERWVWYPNYVIHGLYASWCESNGIKAVLSMQQLASDLERHKLERDPIPRWVRPCIGKPKTARGWWGPPAFSEIPSHLSWA